MVVTSVFKDFKISSKNLKGEFDFAKYYRNEPQSWLYQSEEKAKLWRKKKSTHDPKHTRSL